MNQLEVTLNDFYTACGTKSGCQVVQTLIGDTVEAGLESYVNFYTPPPKHKHQPHHQHQPPQHNLLP